MTPIRAADTLVATMVAHSVGGRGLGSSREKGGSGAARSRPPLDLLGTLERNRPVFRFFFSAGCYASVAVSSPELVATRSQAAGVAAE